MAWSRRVQHRLDLPNMQAKGFLAEENVGGSGEDFVWIQQFLETALRGVGILKKRQISDMPHPRKRINSRLNEINM